MRRILYLLEHSGKHTQVCQCLVNFSLSAHYSPFLWGEAALEQQKLRQDILWSPADMSDVLKLLDTHKLLKSASHFPIHLQLEVSQPQDIVVWQSQIENKHRLMNGRLSVH